MQTQPIQCMDAKQPYLQDEATATEKKGNTSHAFKYLGVWFDRMVLGSMQITKITEKEKEWVGRVEWTSRVNGRVEADREDCQTFIQSCYRCV